ncbi:MAG: YceI family protein [Burkholderiales bacterium]|nr:YceI family protein [Burkholderiales bacterium]
MKSLSRVLVLIGTAAIANIAHAVEYAAVLADKSTVVFTSRQMGVPVQGSFPKFTTKLQFDPARPEAAKVELSIDLATKDAGSKDANDEVVGKQWFNVKTFPMATFTSTTVKSVGPASYEVTGPLTIKGKSVPVIAAFTYKADGTNGVFDGGFVLKRIDFAIGEGPWADVSTVANEIQVKFRVVATASATAPAAPAKSLTKSK